MEQPEGTVESGVSATAHLLREGERCLVIHDYGHAATCFAHARELDGDSSPLPLLGLARLAILCQRLDDADSLATEALRMHPASVEAMTVKALVEEAQGKSDEAIARLKEATTKDARFALAQLNLGRLLAQRTDWKNALGALRAAHAIAPDAQGVVPLLAVAGARCGEMHESALLLCQHLTRAPDDVDGIVTLADLLVETDKLPLARELLENSCGRLPMSAVLHARMAAVLLLCGDVDAARVSVARQLAIVPGDVEAALFSASLDVLKSDFVLAEAKVSKVLARQPENWRAHHLLGMIYEALRREKAAKAAYAKASELRPDAWEPRTNLAVLSLESGDSRAAKQALAAPALQTSPSVAQTMPPSAQFNLALAHYCERETREAREVLRHLASGGEGTPLTAQARRLLEAMGNQAAA